MTSKQSCIFVTGPESSGSTLIAKILSEVLGNPSWTGRGFNCCNDWQCDEASGYTQPCRPVEHLVCHRSLPFKHFWPPIDRWKEMYDGKYIICTRDKNISRNSQLTRFKWKTDGLLLEEEKKVAGLLDDLINDPNTPTFIWSYETYVLLGHSYLNLLADFVEIPRANFEHIKPPRNENNKYISTPRRKLGLHRFISRF